jgi:uncharacterized protein (TIRG00374 family)
VAAQLARGSFWRSRWWRVGRFLLGLALAALAFFALNGQRDELVGASSALARLRPGWLLLAIASEVLSFISFGALQRRLLRCGKVASGLGAMTALALAAGAIASSVPAGPAFSSVYAFRQYRRKGADEAVAGWVLLATLVCAAFALALFSTVGVLVAERQGSSYDLVGVTLGILAVSAVADAVVWQRRWLARLAVGLLAQVRKVSGHPRREAVEVVDELVERLSSVRLAWTDVVVTVLFALGDWVFDCGCLACGFLAVGAPVPWRGLLLAYGAGQLAANLPITPGGLGLVEGSLTVALVAFGGAELSTVSAVLCYRVVSFWGYLPVGWGSWGITTLKHRREDRRWARLGASEGGPDPAGPPQLERALFGLGRVGAVGEPDLGGAGAPGGGGAGEPDEGGEAVSG